MRKSVSSVLAVLAVTAGLTLTPGVAFAGDDNSGHDGGVGHNNDTRGLVGGILPINGNCNVNVNVLGRSHCTSADNYGGGGAGWESDSIGYYPTLYNQNQLNLVEYGYATPVPVCNYGTWNEFEGFARPRLGGRFDNLRSRFGRTYGAWNTGWERVRAEGGCPTVVEQPTIVAYQPTSYIPQSGGSELSSPGPQGQQQVQRPSNGGSVDTGDGSTVK